ncbi:hypothetical protein [Levilactobacillus suantsaiihabitans]|uniref:Uncharacterized protein n=1 Tax=Levilactobacillus suantsaiihabitans TaxID=2487722 RepID=A0A4Z0J897_9LACO|nr:hypothetical protein [Levilactobacillus suantsaiihabitans]TGD17627.1 hypothetical protein EGT51_11680 [Levilactobacillus suantsaiihabitans]
MVEWVPAENGVTIGQLGTEGGVIFRDEEWPGVGRITLERKRTEAAITCGLYGTFFDTAFTSPAEGNQKYDAMKAALEKSPDDVQGLGEWCDWFVGHF